MITEILTGKDESGNELQIILEGSSAQVYDYHHKIFYLCMYTDRGKPSLVITVDGVPYHFTTITSYCFDDVKQWAKSIEIIEMEHDEEYMKKQIEIHPSQLKTGDEPSPLHKLLHGLKEIHSSALSDAAKTNTLDPNRCEVCDLIITGGKVVHCSVTRNPIADVSKRDPNCPKK